MVRILLRFMESGLAGNRDQDRSERKKLGRELGSATYLQFAQIRLVFLARNAQYECLGRHKGDADV